MIRSMIINLAVAAVMVAVWLVEAITNPRHP